jgi:hypothetical protein
MTEAGFWYRAVASRPVELFCRAFNRCFGAYFLTGDEFALQCWGYPATKDMRPSEASAQVSRQDVDEDEELHDL